MLRIDGIIDDVSTVSALDHNVSRVNSIKKLYAHWRQESKPPTFALTYQGTFITLMTNCGFTKKLAQSIEASYHDLYEVSDKWVQEKLEQACKDGYVTLAFGLRLRTPLLKQVILGTSKTPYEAASEGRTAGNALGQGYCMLNSRANSEFMDKVRNSPYAHDIKPCAQIHDAGYFMIRDNMETLMFTNEHLAKAVAWQEDPNIMHDVIKMSGELSIFHPHWGSEMTIPNGATLPVIQAKILEHLEKINGN